MSASFRVAPTFGGVMGLAAVLGVGILAAVLYAKRKDIASSAAAVADAVNPTSANNLAYRAANSLTEAVTGDTGTSFGAKLWEWTHPAQVAKENAINEPIEAPRAPGSDVFTDYVGDLPWDDTNGFVSNNGGAAVGILRKK